MEKKKIVIQGDYNSGPYSEPAILLIKALRKAGIEAYGSPYPDYSRNKYLGDLEYVPGDGEEVLVFRGIPPLAPRDCRIIYTDWETRDYPPAWASSLRAVPDRSFLVSSENCYWAMERYAVRFHEMMVIPPYIDIDFWSKRVETARDPRPTFLLSGEWSPRENQEAAITAFARACGTNGVLIINTWTVDETPTKVRNEIRNRVRKFLAGLGVKANIRLVFNYLPDERLRELLAHVDAVIFPGKGYGNSALLLKAQAAGKKVIAPEHTALKGQIADSQYTISFQEALAVPGIPNTPYNLMQTWYDPCVTDIAKCMVTIAKSKLPPVDEQAQQKVKDVLDAYPVERVKEFIFERMETSRETSSVHS